MWLINPIGIGSVDAIGNLKLELKVERLAAYCKQKRGL